MVRRAVVLIIEDEGLFVELMDSFSPQRYTLVFAADLAEANAQCQEPPPTLVMVRTHGLEADLLELLTSIRLRGTRILGLADSSTFSPDPLFDLVVRRDDPKLVLARTRHLIHERRRSPRAAMTFLAQIEGVGSVTVTRISARSLFVPGPSTLEVGHEVRIEIAAGQNHLASNAHVVRRAGGDEEGTVFEIPDSAGEMQKLLDALVRQSIMLQHLQRTPVGGAARLSITHRVVSHTRDLLTETRKWRDTIETPPVVLPAPPIPAVPVDAVDLDALAREWEALAQELTPLKNR